MKELTEKKGLEEFGWMEMPERVELKIHEENPMYRMVFLAREARKAL